MDDTSKAELDRILALEPAALTEPDKDFLRARSSYIPEWQREAYADILGSTQVSDEADQSDQEAKPKKGKV